MNGIPYSGNTTGNVSRDAKYSIRHGGDRDWQIEITYYIGPTEYVRPSTREHPRLVELVNRAKDWPGGTFYINEFQHVLIRRADNLYCVGSYDGLLEFEVSGVVVSAEPPPGLKPGQEWIGPHAGRPYVLAANCRDIYYKLMSGSHFREERLSLRVGSAAASKLASRLAEVKGPQGGRIYINERKHFFAPVDGSEDFLYLGSLGNDAWFPQPSV